MKKPIFLLLCVFLVSAVGVSAQQETFQEETLRNLIKTASEKLDGEPYRVTSRSESFKIGNAVPHFAQKTVTEFIPPDRRYYSIEKTDESGKPTSFETITIGRDFYFRENNGKWRKPGGGLGSGSGRGQGSGFDSEKTTIENRTERKLSRNVIINGQTADLFETTRTYRYSYKSEIYSVITKFAYWFDSEGRFLKSSFEDEDTESQIISKGISEYEYDANIKIEHPILESGEEITQDEYYRQYRAALNQPFKTSKRITRKSQSYDAQGKPSSSEESVSEYLQPDRNRTVETRKSADSNEKKELIQIGETYYCRKNVGNWTISDRWCGNPSFRIAPPSLTSKITVENVEFEKRQTKLYRKYITYEVDEKVYFMDEKFWVDDKGFMIREETIIGNTQTDKITYNEAVVYEYDLKNIKIEAPIVKKK